MIDALFIDFKTLAQDKTARPESVLALKDVVKHSHKIKIICVNTDDEMHDAFDYDHMLTSLSQTLNLKKSLFFEALHLSMWSEAVGKISSWLSVNEVRSFAVVVNGANVGDIGSAYANNVICCDMFSEAQAKDVAWILSNFKCSSASDGNVWFISDTHFGHANIVKYCNRPWNSGKDAAGNIIVTSDDVKAMNEDMVKRWNSVVSDNDIVWHLGDFSFGGKETAEQVFPRLKGKINLVMGNHDHYKIKWYYDLGFHRVYDRKVIINDYVILSHAPLMFLNENTPFYNVFGHVHDSSAYQTWSKTSCCVCVERHDYTPVSWSTIKAKYDELNGEV